MHIEIHIPKFIRATHNTSFFFWLGFWVVLFFGKRDKSLYAYKDPSCKLCAPGRKQKRTIPWACSIVACLSSPHSLLISVPLLLPLNYFSLKTYHLKYFHWKIQGIQATLRFQTPLKQESILITLKFTHLDCVSPPVGAILKGIEFITSSFNVPQNLFIASHSFLLWTLSFYLHTWTTDLCFFLPENTILTYP